MTTIGRVLVVRTVHHETGNATAEELHWLLGRLRPDVIFLEHSASEVAAYPDTLWDSLELAAVVRYREHNPVEVVPVGLDIANAAELKPVFDAMIERIEEASPRYCQLEVAHYQETEKGGLAFLNSPASAVLQYHRQRELRATLDSLADPVLMGVYGRWVQVNHLREMAVLSGVERYACSKPFHKAVLLVGAAHWQSLAEQSRDRSRECSRPVAWDFEWDLDLDYHDRGPGADGRVET